MPPRAVRKGSGGAASGRKTAVRMAKGTPKSQSQPEPVEEVPKVEEISVFITEEKEEVKVEEFTEEKPEEKSVMLDPNSNGSADVEYEEDLKDGYEEEDKGERLELEGNKPEYEPEEDAAVDYDENDLEPDDGQEE